MSYLQGYTIILLSILLGILAFLVICILIAPTY